MAEYFKGFSPGDHTLQTHLESSWLKMAQSPLNDTTQPVDSETEGRSPAKDRWRLKTILEHGGVL